MILVITSDNPDRFRQWIRYDKCSFPMICTGAGGSRIPYAENAGRIAEEVTLSGLVGAKAKDTR